VLGGGRLLHRAGLLVLDGSRLGYDGLLVGDGDPETQLQLGLGGTVELLVDRGVGRVEGDEGRGAVRVAFEESLGRGRDGEQVSKLWRENRSALHPRRNASG
jgi:hypothetical protein